MQEPRIAIVADWLTNLAGAERVLQAWRQIWPEAPLYTTIWNPKKTAALTQNTEVITSSLQRLPSFIRRQQLLISQLPRAIETLDLSAYDIVISSSSYVGKGVITHPHQLHICYCHTPTRFLSQAMHEYLRYSTVPSWAYGFYHAMTAGLRHWDMVAARRPDRIIANSEAIQQAIWKSYRREASVIAPPVQTQRFRQKKGHLTAKEAPYLSLGRLVPQKRVDLVVKAFLQMPQRELIIAGGGPMEKKLKKMTKNAPNITWYGVPSENQVEELMQRATALLTPQYEDAGITALEGLASGTPVISYDEGGAKSLLNPPLTGVHFREQTERELTRAIEEHEQKDYDPARLREHALQYGEEAFCQAFSQEVYGAWEDFLAGRGKRRG